MNDLHAALFASRDPSPAAAPGARGISRAEAVYQHLRDDIFELRLLPGERLTEGTIAKRFGVSRTPAREALQRLQSDGLMQGYVRGGWEVVPIDFKRFDDLYEMRELIETFAIRKLCTAPPDDMARRAIDELDAIWKVPPAARERDGRKVAELDEAFHYTLVAATGNDELSAALERVTARIRVVRWLDLVHGDCLDETYDEHGVILDAIRAADLPLALTRMEAHIQGSRAEVRKLTLHRLHSVRTKSAM
ncbi:GntR family transcriptional regulator [Burkholderia perseverans]|uniref:GntR family transcriptional regulator n=1 Tax=Burkholderia perseverans TaxID=2615214 RepID=UPI001FF02BA2|nr:GntR family transcriptional regulator [Burkholderia perseverans]